MCVKQIDFMNEKENETKHDHRQELRKIKIIKTDRDRRGGGGEERDERRKEQRVLLY